MDIDFAVLADQANTSQNGKMNIMGIFDRFSPQRVPFQWPRFCLALRIVFYPDDVGTHQLHIRCVKDGVVVKDFGKPELNVQQVPEPRSAQQMILNINNFEFGEEGEYTFEIEHNGQQIAAVPLTVQVRDNQQPAQQEGAAPTLPGSGAMEA